MAEAQKAEIPAILQELTQTPNRFTLLSSRHWNYPSDDPGVGSEIERQPKLYHSLLKGVTVVFHPSFINYPIFFYPYSPHSTQHDDSPESPDQ
jgi:hypothetical protein